MNHDVIPDEGWCLDKAPIQRDGSAPRTRPPPRPLVPHRDPIDLDLKPGCKFNHHGRQLPRRQPPQVTFNYRAQIRTHGGFDHLVAKLDLAILAGLNLDRLTAKEDICAEMPVDWMFRPGRQPLDLLLQPRDVPFGKTLSLGDRAAARDGHSGRAIRPQTEQVAPCPGMTHHDERDRLRTNSQCQDWRGGFVSSENKIQHPHS